MGGIVNSVTAASFAAGTEVSIEEAAEHADETHRGGLLPNACRWIDCGLAAVSQHDSADDDPGKEGDFTPGDPDVPRVLKSSTRP